MPIKAENFIFEKRVRLNCFYCSKYDTKWTCPPRIPELDYEVILSEYQNLAILKYERIFSKEEFDLVRSESTNDVHRMLLKLEKYLYEHNDSLAISFIGDRVNFARTVVQRINVTIREWQEYHWKLQE